MLNPAQEEFENPSEKFGLPEYRRKNLMELNGSENPLSYGSRLGNNTKMKHCNG